MLHLPMICDRSEVQVNEVSNWLPIINRPLQHVLS